MNDWIQHHPTAGGGDELEDIHTLGNALAIVRMPQAPSRSPPEISTVPTRLPPPTMKGGQVKVRLTPETAQRIWPPVLSRLF